MIRELFAQDMQWKGAMARATVSARIAYLFCKNE
jgi:hypothetical protein